MKPPKTAKKNNFMARNLLSERLDAAADRTKNLLTAEQVVQESKVKVKSLNESCSDKTCSPVGQPLEKSYIQYIKQGNSFSPAGNVVLQDKLDNCPYKINLTMAGPVFERVKPNMDEILRFENSALNKVCKEIDRFWESKADYDKLGLVHSRGILMHSKPGLGKSVCLQQVVEMMSARGDVVFLVDSADAILAGVSAFRQIEPDRKVVVSFEEADELCRYNERTLLRIMDGDQKLSNVLYLGTTNYLDRIPPRLTRPGRFDRLIKIDPPTLEHRLQYLSHKLAKFEDAAEIKRLAEKTAGFGFGHLRELIAAVYAVGDPVEEVLNRLVSERSAE